MTDRVPEWVYMADVPPPTDEEPWVKTGHTICQRGACASCDLLRSLDRRRSGTLAAACFLGCLVLVVAWWLR